MCGFFGIINYSGKKDLKGLEIFQNVVDGDLTQVTRPIESWANRHPTKQENEIDFDQKIG